MHPRFGKLLGTRNIFQKEFGLYQIIEQSFVFRVHPSALFQNVFRLFIFFLLKIDFRLKFVSNRIVGGDGILQCLCYDKSFLRGWSELIPEIKEVKFDEVKKEEEAKKTQQKKDTTQR